MSLATQITALGQRVAAEFKAQRARRALPTYVGLTGGNGSFDPATGIYNFTAANNAAFSTATRSATQKIGVCHDVFIGASDMSGYDGALLRAPLSWPEYYRQTMATLGMASGGTGLLPMGDALGVSDSRIVLSGFAAAFGGDFTYAGGAAATATFTPDLAGQLVLTYDQTSVSFTVKIGAAAAVPVMTTGAANTIGVYSPAGTVPAGTAVVITSGGALTLFEIGTIATTGYHKHNLAGSSMGAATSADATHFTSSLLDGAWDPNISPSYFSRARHAYSSLTLAGVVANRVTISLGANDLAGGKTPAQVTASLTNIIAKFPGATIRLVLPWQLGTLPDSSWEALAAALYAYAYANGYQLVDWRYLLGNYAKMQTSAILGTDGYHLALPAQQVFGDLLACADYDLVGHIITPTTNVQTFISGVPGPWTKPSGYSPNARVQVQVWGGGQGGAGGNQAAAATAVNGGRGGVGGAYSERWFLLSDLANTEAITIGGGTPGTAGASSGSAAAATAGQLSAFSTSGNAKYTPANGGGVGLPSLGMTGTAPQSSAGGSTTGADGTYQSGGAGGTGGNGGGINASNTVAVGGRGASTNGVITDGPAPGAVSGPGGTGIAKTTFAGDGGGGGGSGAATTGTGGAGGAGGFPGGGGGGGGGSRTLGGAGGSGANGQVRVTVFP